MAASTPRVFYAAARRTYHILGGAALIALTLMAMLCCRLKSSSTVSESIADACA